ncbi:MAG: hypothetical protein CMJ29_12855 [Phycisphaerae bacterium]|nr:hypothetical protein [Phycisphaerae bacterium]MAT82518.1 hypothetical protein [Phycisphaerae bacterium]|tara:strand:- start:219 stop:1007 length:789 start_codon:yes stop_codon:yes gene_type:complete
MLESIKPPGVDQHEERQHNMDSLNGTPTPEPRDEPKSSRRFFVLAGSLFLAGCATRSKTVVSSLPDPWWTPTTMPDPKASKPKSPAVAAVPPTGVIARSAWAGGNPVPSRMDANRSISRITIHHDGMQPFTDTSYKAAARRLESIRRAHLGRKPQRFGDIGYHYAIDPAGRIWSCRPLSYQGAHVKGQNPGNLGIVVLGNYDKQSVNRAQQVALAAFLSAQSRQYRVPVSRIYTHQEMSPTACPGRSLQKYMVQARRNGTIA